MPEFLDAEHYKLKSQLLLIEFIVFIGKFTKKQLIKPVFCKKKKHLKIFFLKKHLLRDFLLKKTP